MAGTRLWIDEIRPSLAAVITEVIAPHFETSAEDVDKAVERLLWELRFREPALGHRSYQSGKFGFVGVCHHFDKKRGRDRYRARLAKDRKVHLSPWCKTPEEAAKFYDEFQREHRGPGYPVNFPGEGEIGFLKDVDREKTCPYGHSRERYGYVYYKTGKVSCRACNAWAADRLKRRSQLEPQSENRS